MNVKFKIVLIPFPFNDVLSSKLRPALILSEPQGKHRHIIVAYITSHKPDKKLKNEFDLELPANKETGLIKKSWLCLYRLTSLSDKIIQRELGMLPKKNNQEINTALTKIFNLSNLNN